MLSFRKTDSRSYTLIELLVVIGIIGILVAILLPALYLAKDAAKKATCSNRLKQISSGLAVYQHNFKKFPVRLGQKDWNQVSTPNLLYHDDTYEDMAYDWRGYRGGPDYRPRTDLPAYKEFVDVNKLQCPYVEQLELKDTTQFSRSVSPYRFYAGWMPSQKGGYDPVSADATVRPMTKMTMFMVRNRKKFDIVAADWDMFWNDGANQRAESSHPDIRKAMKLVTTTDPAQSVWVSASTFNRPGVDMNYARKDGSVFTIPRVKPADPRCRRIDYRYANNGGQDFTVRWSLLPSIDQMD